MSKQDLPGSSLEPIEKASRDELQALQLQRMKWSLQHVYDKVPHYRKKYDAAKVIAEFGATCRDETDLEKLTARLVEVVQETMQPESVSLWLKSSPPSPLREAPPWGSRPFGSGEGGGA